jgi:hypothetical protein
MRRSRRTDAKACLRRFEDVKFDTHKLRRWTARGVNAVADRMRREMYRNIDLKTCFTRRSLLSSAAPLAMGARAF